MHAKRAQINKTVKHYQHSMIFKDDTIPQCILCVKHLLQLNNTARITRSGKSGRKHSLRDTALWENSH